MRCSTCRLTHFYNWIADRPLNRVTHAQAMEERFAAQRMAPHGAIPVEESVAVEEPLEIHINGSPWVTTMRTPGQDDALAIGLLYTEGILSNSSEVTTIELEENVIIIQGDLSAEGHTRGFVRSSSCGVCGSASLESVLARNPPKIPADGFSLQFGDIEQLIEKLNSSQSFFQTTGGMHAVALFDQSLELVNLSEDVGRHNAMDKIIGQSIDKLPLSRFGFLLSGRVSFEMVQKAVMVGSPCIIAIGAPTSLAIQLARQHGMTLIGFARESRCNIYTGAWRIQGVE